MQEEGGGGGGVGRTEEGRAWLDEFIIADACG